MFIVWRSSFFLVFPHVSYHNHPLTFVGDSNRNSLTKWNEAPIPAKEWNKGKVSRCAIIRLLETLIWLFDILEHDVKIIINALHVL